MLCFTFWKSVNFWPGISLNSAYCYGSLSTGSYIKRISKGLRVTTPEPLGRQSIPTICYSKDDLPDDWFPTTTILGNLIYS